MQVYHYVYFGKVSDSSDGFIRMPLPHFAEMGVSVLELNINVEYLTN